MNEETHPISQDPSRNVPVSIVRVSNVDEEREPLLLEASTSFEKYTRKANNFVFFSYLSCFVTSIAHLNVCTYFVNVLICYELASEQIQLTSTRTHRYTLQAEEHKCI